MRDPATAGQILNKFKIINSNIKTVLNFEHLPASQRGEKFDIIWNLVL